MPEVLAIIPAVSGSSRISHLYLRSFRGKPLLAHSVLQATQAEAVSRVIVSTDNEEYAALARAYGAEAPFLRPVELVPDLSKELDLFQHALGWLNEHESYRPEICVHLRPAYPTRTAADIDGAVRLLLDHAGADSVRSVAPAPCSPYEMCQLGRDGLLRPILDRPLSETGDDGRGPLPPALVQNSAVDATRTQIILDRGSMTGTRILGFEMLPIRAIDDWCDLEHAKGDLVRNGRLPESTTFVFDLDGVIARLVPDNDYAQAQPDAEMISVVNSLFDAGNRIVLHTARGAVTGIDWRNLTERQLRAWGLRYHELRFGKPAADYYVDDRGLSVGSVLSWFEQARR